MMLTKPAECEGCPLYGDGKGFVPDRMVEGAEVLVLAQNPGEHEEKGQRIIRFEYASRRRVPITEATDPQPLIGNTGYDMDHEYLPLTGLARDQVSVANVIKCRWIKNGKRTNDLPPAKILDPAVDHCTRAYLKIPPSVRLVVAMGALSNKFLGCPGSVSSWRGFTYEVKA